MIPSGCLPLIHKMAEVARTSPRVWSELVAEFKAYTDRGKDQLMVTPAPNLQHVQGRVYERSQVFEMIENCVALSNKAARK